MSTRRQGELSAQLITLCERASSLLRSPSALGSAWSALGVSSAQSLEGLAEALRESRRPLTILMLGGTGVGKSTLLNAIAGAEVSQSSSGRRAFTSALHVYHHEETSIEYLSALSATVSVPHTAPQLIDKIIIDAPDIDSTERAHHELVAEALNHIDVILYVTTWQKYRNRVITQTLGRHLGSHSVLCVLNQADELSAPDLEEVSADLQLTLRELGLQVSHVLPVSALSACRAAAGEPVSPSLLEGFNTLNRLLREELTLTEVRRLTQLSATRQALRSVALIPQRMGWRGGFEGQLQVLLSAERLLSAQLSELTREAGRSLAVLTRELLTERDSARDAGVNGPYGLYLTSQRWLAGQGYGRGATGEGSGDHEGRAEHWIEAQLAQLTSLTARLEALAREGGWSAHVAETSALSAEQVRALKSALSAHLSLSASPSPRPRSALELNALPWLTTSVICYWLLSRVIEGPEPGLVSLIFGLGVIYASCAAQERLLSELDRRALAPSALGADMPGELLEQLSPYLELKALEGRLLQSHDQLKGLLEVSAALAALHNQLNQAARASEGERAALLEALYQSAVVQPKG